MCLSFVTKRRGLVKATHESDAEPGDECSFKSPDYDLIVRLFSTLTLEIE